MSSFLKHFQRKEKCENMVKNKCLNSMKESDMKALKLKDNLMFYSIVFEKNNDLKEPETNQLNDEIKNKKNIKKKKRNKCYSTNNRFKTKKNDAKNIKKLILERNRTSRAFNNLKFVKKKETNNSAILFPKINIIPEKKQNNNNNKNDEEKQVNNSPNENKIEKKEKEKKKIIIKKNIDSEKSKIIINEGKGQIFSMNGGHTNNFTSKYLMEVSKINNNVLDGIIDYDINFNIRGENKSICASFSKKDQSKNIKENKIIPKEENKDEQNVSPKRNINNNYFENKNIINYNNFLKTREDMLTNERNKRKEELKKRFVEVRKEYKDKEYFQCIKNTKTYVYLILQGNASYLIKNCMCHRINWKEAFSSATYLFNFKWQQISFGIDYNSLGCITNTKQLVNHFENHFDLTNKANMFLNLMEYCEKRKLSVFKYVPFTIVFQFKDKNDFENNNEIKKRDKKRMEKLKEFIKDYKNYIVNYEEIGKFYGDEKYKKEMMKRNIKELYGKKIIKKKKKKKEEIDKTNNINDNNNNKINITLYNDYFYDVKLIEKIKKVNKDKEGNYFYVDEKINENIGKNTLIEIPSTHNSGNNLWIIKPINLNRGMCIKIVNSMGQIEEAINKFKEGVKFAYTKEGNNNELQNIFLENMNDDIEITEEDDKSIENKDKIYYCNRIIIQKYIERPLLYKKRKCDIRIWVLLTQSMNVYVFKEGHLKTCSVEYDLNSKNLFSHITNYSFQKRNNNFQKFEKGNEVPFHEFQKFIDENYPEKNYKLNIDLMEKIKEIIYISMRSIKQKINKNNRNYQFEIFGYDFMLDENFNVFLIEINTNPGLEESSPWIKIIVPRMLDDALRLTLDQLFEPKYDFNHNYKKPKNIEKLFDKLKQSQKEKIENNINKENKEYISPFPVPGYKEDDNLWEFVCDLNERDPLDDFINNENKTTDKNTSIIYFLKNKSK